MTSTPPVTDEVSPELYEVFKILIAIQEEDGGPVPTLKVAHEFICTNAPTTVFSILADGSETPGIPTWPQHDLIEFGQLLERYGPDARLDDFSPTQAEDDEPFLVRWKIDVEAHGPKDAARKALELAQQPTTATVFKVANKRGDSWTVDLAQNTCVPIG